MAKIFFIFEEIMYFCGKEKELTARNNEENNTSIDRISLLLLLMLCS
jgi:hypothetical protein